MVDDMGQMVLISIDGNSAIYDLFREEDGNSYAYPVFFIKDEQGIWKISDF